MAGAVMPAYATALFFCFSGIQHEGRAGQGVPFSMGSRGLGLFHDFYFTVSPPETGLASQWQQGIA
ncbi:hypothetical protein D3W54_10845 [Komagataeibacter medellinensis]|uniref:Uncharacterized protein n=1 Tax=Komagataeibacter medellinensis TaxID=1177712 RepID=A0ABQ6W1J5_9PROT|nr:hypothetical protein D3W54_10845 [Komagataeibacter medellinensis]